MDRLRAIEYFMKVAEVKSFSAAAKSFGVPASSISRRIQDLEAALGATLLTRTTRVVKLTELGELYFENASKAVSALDYADELIKDRPGSPAGMLRITSTPGYGRFKLVPALRKLRELYPEIVVDLELTDQVRSLAGDEADLAIRATSELPDRAIARKLTDNNYMLVASPEYLERHPSPQKLADIADHRTILYHAPGRVVHWQVKTESGWAELQTAPAFICNLGEEIVHEAEVGTGLALVPRWGIETQLASRVLVPIELGDASLSISRSNASGIYLLYHQPKYRLNKIKAAVDFLMEELS